MILQNFKWIFKYILYFTYFHSKHKVVLLNLLPQLHQVLNLLPQLHQELILLPHLHQELLKLQPRQTSLNLQGKGLHRLNLEHLQYLVEHLHLHCLEQMLLELEQKGAKANLHLQCQVIHISLAVATTSAKVICHVSLIFCWLCYKHCQVYFNVANI